jgi:galactokinase
VIPKLEPRLVELVDRIGRHRDAVRFARAPGRVNLIGEHTDYQDGFCLPMSIDRDVIVAWAPRTDGRIRLRSLDFEAVAEFDADALASTVAPEWARPAAGMVATIGLARGVGLDAAVSSTVPIGAGLSSSAAFEVAIGVALGAANNAMVGGNDLARAAQQAEHLATGVPCGVMDQMASVHGRSGHALLLDCRSLTVSPVAIPNELAVLVVHCGVARTLVGSEYAQRRAAVEEAAARLGLATLRDAMPEAVSDDRFARHVVTENRRTLMFVAALRRGRIAELGELLADSHRSLRDDYAVSTPALDTLVDSLVDAGALGARLTGAGFGGCVVALTSESEAEAIAARACERYRARTGHEPDPFIVRATDGAGEIDPR